MKKLLACATLSLAMMALPAKSADQPDTWILAKTKIALMTAHDVNASAIDVDVKDGVVTLKGKVTTQAEKANAEKTAGGISGARKVENLLQVVAESKKEAVEEKDDTIKADVKKKLDAAKDLSEISVDSVNAGVVVLQGKAPVAKVARAVEIARREPGVKRVVSKVEASDDKM